jgi:hypothetical protein
VLHIHHRLETEHIGFDIFDRPIEGANPAVNTEDDQVRLEVDDLLELDGGE